MKAFLNQKKNLVIAGTVASIVGSFIVFPTLFLNAGNIFFGKYQLLYNVRFAQFFFHIATLHPEVPQYAQYQLSRTYFIQGKFQNAIEEAEKELQLFPENIKTYYILGLTYGYMHREEEAIEAFGKFIEFKNDSWAARNDRAWLQFRIGDLQGALETLESVSGYRGNPWVQNTYGVLLMNSGRFDEAKSAFIYAEKSLEQMTEDDWGNAYPGNDPRVYGEGLKSMKDSIRGNLAIIESI